MRYSFSRTGVKARRNTEKDDASDPRVDVDGIPLRRVGSSVQLLVGIHYESGVEIIADDGRHLLGEGGGCAFGQIADGLGVGEVVAVVSEGGSAAAAASMRGKQR
jgi:hypothetical protein